MARRFAYPGLRDELEAAYRPPNGWCANPRCKACNEARARMRADLQASSNAVSVRRNGFSEGYEQARQELEQQAYRLAETMTAEQIAHVRAQQTAREAQSYQRGYAQGLAQGRQGTPATQSQPAPGGLTMDQVLNECHIIGESNPNMKPAMNALRHRIKKLKR